MCVKVFINGSLIVNFVVVSRVSFNKVYRFIVIQRCVNLFYYIVKLSFVVGAERGGGGLITYIARSIWVKVYIVMIIIIFPSKCYIFSDDSLLLGNGYRFSSLTHRHRK